MTEGSSTAQGILSANARLCILVLLAILLLPHTLAFQHWGYTGSTEDRIIFVTSFWVLFYSYGSNMAGPFATGGIISPDPYALLSTMTALVLVFPVLYWTHRYARGRCERKTVFKTALASLLIQLFVDGGFLSVTLLNGFSFYSVFLPFPAVVVSVIVLGFRQARSTMSTG